MPRALLGAFFVSPDPVRARSGGAQVVGAVEEYDGGRFGGSVHPDSHNVELCQVPQEVSAVAERRA